MKNKMVSILLAVFMLCGFASPAAAETISVSPDTVSLVQSDAGVYLDVIYTVPQDIDPASLRKEKVDQDGVIYLFDSLSSEKVSGEVTEMRVRQMVFVRSEDDDLAAVQAAQPKDIPYEKDGFAGTLHLDTAATEMSGPVMRNAAWQSNDAVFTVMWVSESGGESTNGEMKREYEYRFWYVGTVTHTEPDMLRVTVRYLAQNASEEETMNSFFPFPAFSLPAIALPEWLSETPTMLLPIAGLAALATLFLILLSIVFRHRHGDAPDQDDDMATAVNEEKPIGQKKKKERKKSAKVAKANKEAPSAEKMTESRSPMPVPDFLVNMERGGTDTLDEDGSEQYAQRF